MRDTSATIQHHEAPALVAALADGALRRASSAAIFERGKTYADSGAVEVQSEEAGATPTICAIVKGTEDYSTEVSIEEGEVDGSCDCANAQDGWFCKHQVALALVWRRRLSGEAPTIDEAARKKVQASAKRAQTVKDRRQALGDFLHAQSAAALADRLLGLADRDADIARELQQWRKLAQAPRETADLKALVSEILATGSDFIAWRETATYVHRAEAVLPLLAEARERDPAAGMALALHALRRGWAALAHADDSDGEIGGLIQAIGSEWVAALEKAGAQPAPFGEQYLQLLLDDPFGCFDTAAAERAMGAAALARYRKALATRWREAKDALLAAQAARAAVVAQARIAKKRPPYESGNSVHDVRLWTLERLHLGQLEAAGDIEAALGVLREDLFEAANYHRLTEFLERHDRPREAFANAERGCKAFPEDWRLQEDLLRCYERDGWYEEALALRRRRFDERPSVDRYHEVLKAVAAAGGDVGAARADLHVTLSALEEKALKEAAGKPASYAFARTPAAAGQRDVSLRAEVLCSERRFDEALALVRPPAYCRDGVLVYLARHLDPALRQQKSELLLRVFANQMRNSKSPYRQELDLVEEIASLLDPAPRASWLDGLRATYKAKRNFVGGLPAK